MPTVRIRSLSKGALNNRDYDYMRGHLREPLPIFGLNFTDEGKLWGISIYTEHNRCISLFVDFNNLEYEVSYYGDSNYKDN